VYISQHRLISRGIRAYELWSVPAGTAEVRGYAGEIRLFILPRYRFRAIDLLLTNFHLPHSTLFMLVAPWSASIA
jgi:S-adenosylmethionine:tRNA ribosyltransferase-isomerase